MSQDLFEVQTQNWEVIQGDTINIPWRFYDQNGVAINDIVGQSWESRFSLEDPITHDIIAALVKTHNDVPPIGGGIYYNGDVNIIPGLIINANNEVIVALSAAETATLIPAVYPYWFKFFIDQAYSAAFTPVRGNLIVLKRNT